MVLQDRNPQGTASGQGLYPKGRLRLRRDLLAYSMIKSIRILLSIIAHMDYEIWQMDVKTAFLNGSLDETIYMVQLEGFIAKG